MNKMRFGQILGLAIITAVVSTKAANADITIGLIAPLTGPLAAYGEQLKNGAETAVENINRSGGIGGEKVTLKLADDMGDPKQGVSVANQLVGDGIRYVVGPVTSSVSIPVSDVLADNDVLMITPTATAPELTGRGLKNVFRTCGRDDQQAEVSANYFLKNWKDKRVAIIHDNGTYGKGLADAFKRVMNAGGVNEVLYASLIPGEKDLSALIARMKSEKVEVVYFGGFHPEGGLLARQLGDIQIKAQIIGGEGISNSEYWAIANEAASGTIFTNASDATKNPASAEAVATLKEKSIPPEAFTLNTYAAVEVLKYGIEKAGKSASADDVEKALKSGEAIQTAIGKLSYGENGDLGAPRFSLFMWKDGKIVDVE